MNTPVMTKEQQKKTVSSKIKGPVKGLRNVLAQPFNNYWPVVKNDQVGTLEQVMKKSFAPLHCPKTSIPWSQLRKMKKEERLAIKNTKVKSDEISCLSKFIVTGINAVTRGLEKKTLSSVLLDSNVESILIKHIVTMSENENIPVILIPILKSITLETIGFASAAVALKNEVKNSSDNHFRALYDAILELSNGFERPKLPDQLCLAQVYEDEKVIEENASDREMLMDNKIPTVMPTVVSSDVYLYRSSNKERVFVPEGASKDLCISSVKEWSDYIPLNEDINYISMSDTHSANGKNDTTLNRYMGISDKMSSINTKRSIKNGSEKDLVYVPLKIKRMRGNDNRIKSTKVPKSKNKST